MEYRLLGRTGVRVSPLCLGAMMFGPWGNKDTADELAAVDALDTGRRGGPEPDAITLESFGVEIPEA